MNKEKEYLVWTFVWYREGKSISLSSITSIINKENRFKHAKIRLFISTHNNLSCRNNLLWTFHLGLHSGIIIIANKNLIRFQASHDHLGHV